ncbi:hypothetical protein G7Z17_g12447 [Cylindrodendrum hubeiense]|uniref:Uncharacterized protein n=1 Tax=Cylindrodendrum hubeiense TaxID=595255 RepID=A0A9P5L335_9HYPO|nr:hypothetical protein G7Z17_g12447 [Cylindrodendrum hubeiense]
MKAEAMSYGAYGFHDCNSQAEPRLRSIDCLPITAAIQANWEKAMFCVRRGGTISAIAAGASELPLPYMELIMNDIQVQGDPPAPPQMHRDVGVCRDA